VHGNKIFANERKYHLNNEPWKKAPETKLFKNDVHLEQHFIKNMIFTFAC